MINPSDVLFISDGEQELEFRIVACDYVQNLYTGYKYKREDGVSVIKSKTLAIFYISEEEQEFRETNFVYFNEDDNYAGFGFARTGITS